MPAKIIELVDQQVSQGQAIENVLHYVNMDGVATVAQLLADYVEFVITPMVAFQASSCSHVNLRWRQVYPTDTLAQDYAVGLPLSGADSSMPAPTYVAASIKWLLGNPTVVLAGGFTGHIKRGGMRIGGLPLDDLAGNAMLGPHIPQIHAVTTAMLNPGSDDWQLCVASFLVGNPVPPVPPAKHATPRARSTTVTAYTVVTEASDASPSTQNTRKFLRGIAS